MSIEEYNDELNKIKLFHTYLSNILADGYTNEIDDLKKLNNQINNININSEYNDNNDFIDENESDYDCIPFIRNTNKYQSSSSSSSSSDTEDEDDNTKNINKEQLKVERFIKNSNDISNISLYKMNGFEYINIMKNFINKTFIYGN